MENKEIIGYKLKEKCLKYKSAAADIGGYNRDYDIQNFLVKESTIINRLLEAGVLTLWFEPIYKPIEPQFEEGEWLYCSLGKYKALFRYNGLSSTVGDIATNEYYSIDNENKVFAFCTSTNYCHIKDVTKATNSQIQEILTIVAKHKGFVKGVKYMSPVSRFNNTCIGDFIYCGYDVLFCNDVAVYNKGKWANIIPAELVKSWEDAYNLTGYYIEVNSVIVNTNGVPKSRVQKNVFRNEAQAKSALAFAQLSHIVADANGDWVADWNDYSQYKYNIGIGNGKLYMAITTNFEKFLPMKSEEIAKKCLEKHRTLWEDFWMISK